MTATFIKNKLRWLYSPLVKAYRRWKKNKAELIECERFELLEPGVSRVFYFGITIHPNLGDLAQRYCISKWIKENYPDYELVMVKSDVIVNPALTTRFFNHLRRIYTEEDIIVLQSGYCTQDLGGNHPLMHRLVCSNMSDARILMMPQTIFFQNEENRRICSENHNKAKRMLFLARDHVSYEMAKEMFPDIHTKAYPDIVTTLIGSFHFGNEREGVCICTRCDGEKLYSKDEIDALAQKIEASGKKVVQKDTQASGPVNDLVRNLAQCVESEIETYSHYELTITDRYHGTIFSLCAGTPVIVLKTTDHKVTTGADWFKGVYDEYVYVAEDLDDAYHKVDVIVSKALSHELKPYFKMEYYDKLKSLFESI